MIDDEVEAAHDRGTSLLALGDTALAPAAAGPIRLFTRGRAAVLDIYLP